MATINQLTAKEAAQELVISTAATVISSLAAHETAEAAAREAIYLHGTDFWPTYHTVEATGPAYAAVVSARSAYDAALKALAQYP